MKWWSADRYKRYVPVAAGTSGWAIAVWISNGFAIADVPAAPASVIVGSLVVLVAALRRGVSPWILGYGVIVCLSVFGSSAVGSSWAGVTWLPITIAVFELARLSSVFTLALTGSLLVLAAPALTLLQAGDGGAGFSGSPVYFAGFVGAVATPIWFHFAWNAPSQWWGRVVAAASVLVSALAIWSVLISGSRASLLALVAGLIVIPIAHLVFRRSSGFKARRAIRSLVVVLLLVPVIDLGMNATFRGTVGDSTLVSIFAGRVGDSVDQVGSSSPNSVTTRIALWRQAGEILLHEPLGHGIASYTHVNLAYQNEPMLWSGSPHNLAALTAVELGVPGLIVLALLIGLAVWKAAQAGSPALGALAAGTVVMSFDVFSSMPLSALVWWATLGAAMVERQNRTGGHLAARVAPVIALILVSGYFSHRLSGPCGEDCNPVVRYGGHPRLVGPLLRQNGSLLDARVWGQWQDRYPLAFSLAAARAAAHAADDADARLDLLRQYPFFSASSYVSVAVSTESLETSTAVAACGLVRFFDGKPIWRDWRSSATELETLRSELDTLRRDVEPSEEACQSVGIPEISIGFAR